MIHAQSPRSFNFARRARLLGTSALLLAALSACAIRPEPMSLEEQIGQAVSDRAAMFAAQEAVSGPVTLEQALARAFKYNLQHRQTVMERALEDSLLDVSKQDLLPKLTTRAGLRTRSNTQASVSESVATGNVSLEPSTSQERTSGTADVQLSWNILDFGLSYYGAKSQANRILAAEERRRRVVLALSEQVRAAWWEAVTADRLRPQVDAILTQAREVLAYAEQTERQRLLPPLDALRFQKAMLEIVQQLEAVDAELAVAKSQLASLMNLPPGSEYRLAVPAETQLAVPAMPLRLDALERVAMVKRPEIREEAYLARNAAAEARSALLRLLPGANLYAGLNYDTNSYLVNQDWADAGVQVTWNLFTLLNWSKVKQANAARMEVAEARRLALRMAVLTQVNLAWHRYGRATTLFTRAAALQDVEQRILSNTESAALSEAQTRLERVRAAASALLATRARDRAYAEVQNALGSVYASAGLDPLPEVVEGADVDALAAAIAQISRDLEQGKVVVPDFAPLAPAQDGQLMSEATNISGLDTILKVAAAK
ncbi:TolC family protein [Indioceanicola profundi]|uniref:TolC family protein n=1 Tax=Indioceanicola profundi TaxID=2220096 RepID=UPI0013C49BEB|nr:TolC family protein [Indioceanicola profundi]